MTHSESTRIASETFRPACDSWDSYLYQKLLWTNIKLGECRERFKKLEEKYEALKASTQPLQD